MSSDPRDPAAPTSSATPSAAAPPDSAAGPEAESPADKSTDAPATSGTADSRDKPRFKIGTQRPGAVVPRVEPRYQVVAPVAPKPAAQQAAAQPPAAQAAAPQTPPAAQVAAPQTSPIGKAEGGEIASEAAAAPGKIAIETEAAADMADDTSDADDPLRPKPFVAPTLKPRKPPVEHISAGKVQLANIRAELPPELKQELEEALGDMSLEDMLAADKSLPVATADTIEPETRLRAKVLRVHRDDVFFDLGRNQGVLPLKNFPAGPPEPGAVVEVMVSRFNADEGLYELTLVGGSVDVGNWSEVSEGMTVEARVTGHNKGGLECEVNKLRGFIPAGQASLYRIEDLSTLVGQKFACIVTEANADRRNLVLSRRAVLEREQAEAKQKLLGELSVGDVREGIVRSLRDFGAFVDLGGVDGMLHVSQLSWDRIKHPSDVLTLGQKIKVKIQKIDPETGKISLAFRDLAENPWAIAATKYPVGMGVQGTVTKIMEFGAFVRLEPGIEGLVHISELSWQRVFRVSDFLKEGQQIEAKVTSVDAENQRIGLSIKALQAKPVPVKKEKPDEPEPEPEPLPPPKARKTPLKGGLGRASGGADLGLKW